MLKLSICTGAWILTILLLIASITKSENCNINTVAPPVCYRSHKYCHHQYCELLKNSDHFLLNLIHILQDFVSVFLNGTCVYDSLLFSERLETNNSVYSITDLKRFQKLLRNQFKNILPSSKGKLMSNAWISAFNYYVNDTFAFKNVPAKFVKEPKKNEKYVDYKWKGRTLCAIIDKEKHSSKDVLENNILKNVGKAELRHRKTLLDYDTPFFINDDDDSDSLKAHVRVKRSKSESNSFINQHDYLKDLANSFPQNNYDSIDEISSNDDSALDTKREVKSQEFFLNDQQFNEIPVEDEQSKNPNICNNNHDKSDFIDTSSDTIGGNTFINNFKSDDRKNQYSPSLQKSKDNVRLINQGTRETLEERDLPEDPMLAMELVRKKRNDNAKFHRKRALKNEVSSDFQNTIRQNEKFKEEERSVLEPEKSGEHLSPSSSIAANLKAELLRIRRKTKENSREKNSKLKKKKKHAGKKHNISRKSTMGPGRKKNEVRKGDKSRVGTAAVKPRKNNDNFHRRSEKVKKSVENVESVNERFPKNVVGPAWREKVKRGTTNKLDTGNSKLSFAAEKQLPTGSDKIIAKLDENVNTLGMRDEEQEHSIENKRSIDDKILHPRSKNSNHGFLNREDELKYYENIREPGTEEGQCRNQNKDQLSVVEKKEGNRAVRSIEEVKELAKKLVTKVNELQNYLNVEPKKNDKREEKIGTRAIDHLCSNVSSGCDAFKETPDVVQKCVPSTNHGDTIVNIHEGKVDPVKTMGNEKFVKATDKTSLEKKRSLGSRVPKESANTLKRIRKQNRGKTHNKWGKWTDWSSCSVTCGKGRQIRWRYCLNDCSTAETEMEEKACQLPACPPGKFLGIF